VLSHPFPARPISRGIRACKYAGDRRPRRFEAQGTSAPLAWLRRNHRKSLVIDGWIACVIGLCIEPRERATPRAAAPFARHGNRDRGLAVTDLAHAFAGAWA
jgi:hypothetical protein